MRLDIFLLLSQRGVLDKEYIPSFIFFDMREELYILDLSRYSIGIGVSDLETCMDYLHFLGEVK